MANLLYSVSVLPPPHLPSHFFVSCSVAEWIEFETKISNVVTSVSFQLTVTCGDASLDLKHFSMCRLSHVAPKTRVTWCNRNFQTNFFLLPFERELRPLLSFCFICISIRLTRNMTCEVPRSSNAKICQRSLSWEWRILHTWWDIWGFWICFVCVHCEEK